MPVAFIIFYIILFRNRENLNSMVSTKHNYINTSSDHVVTENVVYNMEFPNDEAHGQRTLNNVDTAYNTIPSDMVQHPDEINLPMTYKNLQITDDGGAYSTVDFDDEHHEELHTPQENNTLQIDNEGGDYNTVEFEENTRAKNTKYRITAELQNISCEFSYNMLSQKHDAVPTNSAGDTDSEQITEIDLTYAVVNKSEPSNNNCNRPKQLQVAESGDCYALVNKKTVK